MSKVPSAPRHEGPGAGLRRRPSKWTSRVTAPDFGPLARAARLAAGWPVIAEFARRVGMNPSTISRIEQGTRPNTPWQRVYEIVVGGELPLEVFFPADLIVAAADRVKVARRARSSSGVES